MSVKAPFVLENVYSEEAERTLVQHLQSLLPTAGISKKALMLALSQGESFWSSYFGDHAVRRAARFLFVSFWWDGLQVTSGPTGEEDSAYEVLIPRRKQEAPFLTFYIVRAGAAVGDRAIFLKHSLYVPKPREKKKEGYGALLDTFDIFKISTKPYTDKDREDVSLTKSTLDFEYGVITLEDEPMVRLPLFNVPLQCAFEMVARAVGPRSLEEAWQMRRDGIEVSKEDLIRGNAENETLLCALLQYSLWRRLRMYDKDQLVCLIEGMADARMKCKYDHTYSDITLRNRLHGIFLKHQERQTVQRVAA